MDIFGDDSCDDDNDAIRLARYHNKPFNWGGILYSSPSTRSINITLIPRNSRVDDDLKPFTIFHSDSDDEFNMFSDSSEDPPIHKCFVCGRNIIINDDGELHPSDNKPICKQYSFRGCQVKLREVQQLYKTMEKESVLREHKCHFTRKRTRTRHSLGWKK